MHLNSNLNRNLAKRRRKKVKKLQKMCRTVGKRHKGYTLMFWRNLVFSCYFWFRNSVITISAPVLSRIAKNFTGGHSAVGKIYVFQYFVLF